MPWEVKQSGSNYQVVKQDSGKVVGTHPTREKANKHLSALYAVERRIKKGKHG